MRPESILSSLLQCQLSVEHEGWCVATTGCYSQLYLFSHKIMEDADFDLASSNNGLTRVLPPNTPDLCEEEGEKGGPTSNICTVMDPQPRAEQVTTGVRTLTTR